MTTALKSGARVLGIAESYRTEKSTLCAAVTTTAGVVDGMAFSECTVGGLDATEAIIALWDEAGRPDVQYLLINGIALAWYNIVDLQRLAEYIPIPVLAVTYEESPGLEEAIGEAFEGGEAAARLSYYRSLPPRTPVETQHGPLFVRTVEDSTTDVAQVITAVIRDGRRPEAIRVARIAARGADSWRRAS